MIIEPWQFWTFVIGLGLLAFINGVLVILLWIAGATKGARPWHDAHR
jgi:hypothetical protein